MVRAARLVTFRNDNLKEQHPMLSHTPAPSGREDRDSDRELDDFARQLGADNADDLRRRLDNEK